MTSASARRAEPRPECRRPAGRGLNGLSRSPPALRTQPERKRAPPARHTPETAQKHHVCLEARVAVLESGNSCGTQGRQAFLFSFFNFNFTELWEILTVTPILYLHTLGVQVWKRTFPRC